MKLYVIQHCEGGLPQEPTIYSEKKRAEDQWLELVLDDWYANTNEEGLTRDELMEEALLIDPSNGGNDVRQWTVEVSE